MASGAYVICLLIGTLKTFYPEVTNKQLLIDLISK